MLIVSSVLVSLLCSYLYFSGTVSGALVIVLLVLGAVFLFTAVIAFCPLYAPFKISTYKKG